MELTDNINKVKEFHRTFGLQYHEKPVAKIDEKIVALRHRLMAEENDEYLEACKNNDLNQSSGLAQPEQRKNCLDLL
jgi:predicted HAD superfamily Cof-like phosphohydrolase